MFETSKNPYVDIEKIKIPKAEPTNIESYFEKLPKSVLNSNDITKVHLHFTLEDFAEYQIADQNSRFLSKYPNLSVFYAYQYMNRDVALMRHAGYYPEGFPPVTKGKSKK